MSIKFIVHTWPPATGLSSVSCPCSSWVLPPWPEGMDIGALLIRDSPLRVCIKMHSKNPGHVSFTFFYTVLMPMNDPNAEQASCMRLWRSSFSASKHLAGAYTAQSENETHSPQAGPRPHHASKLWILSLRSKFSLYRGRHASTETADGFRKQEPCRWFSLLHFGFWGNISLSLSLSSKLKPNIQTDNHLEPFFPKCVDSTPHLEPDQTSTHHTWNPTKPPHLEPGVLSVRLLFDSYWEHSQGHRHM